MAITSPGLVLAIDSIWGFIKPKIDALQKIGATDFSADAPGIDIKPGATIKVPIASVAAASEYNESTNNYRTGGSTTYGSLSCTHYLQGFDVSGADIDKGSNATRLKQMFSRRAGAGIGLACQNNARTALDALTASTGVTLPASPTLAQYIALGSDKTWLDKSASCLVLNGAELALVRGVCAAAHLAGSDDEIARYLGFGSIAYIPGMTARAVIAPPSSVGFLARVPAIIARYVQAGAETDPDSGLSIGVIVADNQDTNKQIVDADIWFGTATISSNALATAAGAIKVGTSA